MKVDRGHALIQEITLESTFMGRLDSQTLTMHLNSIGVNLGINSNASYITVSLSELEEAVRLLKTEGKII